MRGARFGPLLLASLVTASAPVFAGTTTLFSRDQPEPVIVFDADDVRNGTLPDRIQTRELAPVLAARLTLACKPLAISGNRQLVFSPRTDDCRRSATLPPGTRQRLQAVQGSVSDAEVLVVLPAPEGTLLACTCPPELIISDSFEPDP